MTSWAELLVNRAACSIAPDWKESDLTQHLGAPVDRARQKRTVVLTYRWGGAFGVWHFWLVAGLIRMFEAHATPDSLPATASEWFANVSGLHLTPRMLDSSAMFIPMEEPGSKTWRAVTGPKGESCDVVAFGEGVTKILFGW